MTSTPKKTKPTAHFNIAQATKKYEEGLDAVEPFTVGLPDGTVVEFVDPRQFGWQTMAAFDLSNPYSYLREVIKDKDAFRAFVDEDFPVPVLREMSDAYGEHYGFDPGNGNG